MDRSWMYNRLTTDGYLSPYFTQGVDDFINDACKQPRVLETNRMRCPCRKCENRRFGPIEDVRYHLNQKGFVLGYNVWIHHGEQYVSRATDHQSSSTFTDTTSGFSTDLGNNPYQTMVLDAAGPSFQPQNFEAAGPSYAPQNF